MFTRKRFVLPTWTPDVARDLGRLGTALYKYFLSLEEPGALSITFDKDSTAPTVTAGSGTLTTVSAVLNYTKYDDRVAFDAVITLTTNGTGATYLSLPLPFTPAANTAGFGRIASSALVLDVAITTGGVALIRLYDGTYPGADGTSFQVGGVYRI